MKNDSAVIPFLIFFVVVLLLILWWGLAHANDYTIAYYGQGVFSIEHDGVIHVMGKGEPVKIGKDSDGDWGRSSNDNEPETDLQRAEMAEKRGYYLNAADWYIEADEPEKAREVAIKDIAEDIAKNPPSYDQASWTAIKYLKDKELAMEYYEKYLDQKLNSGGTDQ